MVSGPSRSGSAYEECDNDKERLRCQSDLIEWQRQASQFQKMKRSDHSFQTCQKCRYDYYVKSNMPVSFTRSALDVSRRGIHKPGQFCGPHGSPMDHIYLIGTDDTSCLYICHHACCFMLRSDHACPAAWGKIRMEIGS